ncbi:inositol polyphosphate-5-phosphatase A-like [Uloborus diversus]|uniref:inositol polyphosphate-5-phosphatase A-like n=1 Tax=Uloborus diversus TaxID=327109 RepID=UPI0024090EA2|nr:inositol polyphosphate-5-phosphatase A-like [Uloborus diversus]XP_054721665.1 inositol polyphosphate-5-phosphatase A-like [Uloborus diversus]XP_054721666.1 inositol polyphosphate-5-phosphatase A-like [Uloborus diversus]XP_054721667.1 inositol polyphosphate-5-phosphatase A-like [Uloborus diversus]
MEDKSVPTLLISANVGSIFEDPQVLLNIWMKEILQVIRCCQPKFFALHCQEVGGKNYRESMQYVDRFLRTLLSSEELKPFGHKRIFLDEEFTCPEIFTALGSLYFIHNSLKDVHIWDFHGSKFVPLIGEEVHKGNIEHVEIKEKSKFPSELFPENKGSRKGFMRTRWKISHTIFDMINVHLFHDESNFIAIEDCPSRYSKNRQQALEYILKRISVDPYEKTPFFIFGDFNFRLDTKGVVQKLTSQTVPVYVKSAKNGEIEKILYKDPQNENKVVLTLERKVFDFDRHQETFATINKWLQEYDREPKVFEEFFEFDITFPPSYPFKEDPSGKSYMRTRCPSWCDRILLSKSALSIINMTPLDGSYCPVVYQLVGAHVGMGDHKPVMLMCNLLRHTDGDDHRKSSQVFSV